MSDSLSISQARRIALAAQGFTDSRPTTPPPAATCAGCSAAPALLQIDSVNVLQRAHYLPVFSRLGPYPTELLDRAAYRAAAGTVRVLGPRGVAAAGGAAAVPALADGRAREDAWGRMLRIARSGPSWSTGCRDEVRDRGPVTAAEIEAGRAPAAPSNWGWNWSDTKAALEWLFWSGEVTAARRNSAFARVYDLTERVLPEAVLRAATPSTDDAMRELVRRLGGRTGRGGRDRAARLLPAAGGRRPQGHRRAGRGGCAAAGDRAGLEAAGLPARRGEAARGSVRRPRWSARSTR